MHTSSVNVSGLSTKTSCLDSSPFKSSYVKKRDTMRIFSKFFLKANSLKDLFESIIPTSYTVLLKTASARSDWPVERGLLQTEEEMDFIFINLSSAKHLTWIQSPNKCVFPHCPRFPSDIKEMKICFTCLILRLLRLVLMLIFKAHKWILSHQVPCLIFDTAILL